MEYDNSLCKLVIRNIGIIEEIPKVAECVDGILMKAINERIEALVKDKGWIGVFDLGIAENLNKTLFRPNDWTITQDDDFIKNAYYEFSWESGKELSYWLSTATQATESAFCLGFWIPEGITGLKTVENKKRLHQFFENNQKLGEIGFEREKNGFIFIRFSFDPEQLENEYPDFTDSLNPVDEAFDGIMKAHPIFNKYVKSFGGKS